MTLLAVAHRAGNSAAGLHEARRLGADVVECDVHAHRGALEVRHLKTAGPLPLLWDRWELAPASAPRLGLAEVLAADRGGARLMLDLKGRRADVGAAVAALLRAGDRREVLVCGRYWPAVDELAGLPFVRPVLSARHPRALAALSRRLRTGAHAAPYGVSLHGSLLDRPEAGRLRDGVEVVMTWPVNDVATLDRVVALGANGVITDSPEVLREVLRRSSRA